MNRLLVCCVLVWLVSVADASGQATPRILRFDRPVMEIGTVRFDGGPVTVRFTYENISDKPVSIVDVHSQCGCARPSFSRKPVAPGEKGCVDVVLDPSGLFAEQNRHLTVIATNNEYRKFNTITIHGYVERDVTETEVRYPYELLPGLRAEVKTVGMRLSGKWETVVKEFAVYNDTDTPMKLGWRSDSRRVKAEVPAVLEPQSSAKVKVSVRTSFWTEGDYVLYLYISSGDNEAVVELKGKVE